MTPAGECRTAVGAMQLCVLRLSAIRLWVPYGCGCHTALGAIRLWVPYGFGCHTAVGAVRLWVPYGVEKELSKGS